MPAVTSAAPATTPASLKAAVVAPADGQFDITGLFVANKAAREASATSLAALAQKDGPKALQTVGFTEAVTKALADKKSPAAREGAATAVSVLVKNGAVTALEPLFIDSGLYAALLEAFADKMPAVGKAAVEAVRSYVAAMNPWAAGLILPALLLEIQSAGKWQIKTGSLQVLNQIIASAPTQTALAASQVKQNQ